MRNLRPPSPALLLTLTQPQGPQQRQLTHLPVNTQQLQVTMHKLTPVWRAFGCCCRCNTTTAHAQSPPTHRHHMVSRQPTLCPPSLRLLASAQQRLGTRDTPRPTSPHCRHQNSNTPSNHAAQPHHTCHIAFCSVTGRHNSTPGCPFGPNHSWTPQLSWAGLLLLLLRSSNAK